MILKHTEVRVLQTVWAGPFEVTHGEPAISLCSSGETKQAGDAFVNA